MLQGSTVTSSTASIAAVKLINYLSGRKINGTVYVVPFLIPSSTARVTGTGMAKTPTA